MANAKRNRISNFVTIFKAGSGKVSYGTFNAATNKIVLPKATLDMPVENQPALIEAMAMRIERIITKNLQGQHTIIAPNEVILKAFTIQKSLNKANGDPDAAAALFFKNMDWMSEEYRIAATDLINQLSEVRKTQGISVFFVKESNLTTWDLTVAEGTEIKKGQKLLFEATQDEESGYWHSTALDGAIECENHFVNGEFEVLEYTTQNPNTGATKSQFRIPRVVNTNENGTGKTSYDQYILNLRALWKKVQERLPKMEAVDLDAIEYEEDDEEEVA